MTPDEAGDLELEPFEGSGVASAGTVPRTLHYFRPSQLLVRRDDADRALGVLPAQQEWRPLWEPAGGEAEATGFVLLEAGAGPPEAVADVVRTLRGVGLRAHLNHVLAGQPRYQGFPLDQPVPAAAPPVRWSGTPGGPSVVVVDTGISKASPLLRDGHVTTASAPEALDGLAPAAALDPQAGHSTFVAGTVLRVAPDAAVEVVGVLDGRGVCDDAELALALAALAAKPPAILNLSLGAYTSANEVLPATGRALGRLLDREVLVVAAGGNDGLGRPLWPASLPGVVGVGAVADDGGGWARARWSNYGSSVDVWAPGEALQGHFVEFQNQAPGVPPHHWEGWATGSGTSFAAPAVAGTVALRMAAAGEPAHVALAALLAAANVLAGDTRRVVEPPVPLT